MIQYLFEQNIITNTFIGLCGLGLLVRFIVSAVYKHLVKESDNPGETKNKMLRHMKLKFETCYRLKIGVNNVDTFVDKSVLRYRFCGVLLSTWDNFCGQVLFLNLLLVPICAVFGVVYNCGQDQVFLAGAVGILTSSIMILVDKSINLSGKKRMLRLNIMDYLENFCKVRLEQETFTPELLEQYRNEYFQGVKEKVHTGKAGVVASEEQKDEINRRREARKKKEEERKLQALKREEEQRRVAEARKEEEKKKLEERKQLAAKRREEEALKLEEEREALEARRAEIKRKAAAKKVPSEQKLVQVEEKEKILHSLEEELQSTEERTDMKQIIQGLDEIAADQEKVQSAKILVEPSKSSVGKAKTAGMSSQEEKLIEDVLKEFFA